MKLVHSAATLSQLHSNISMITVLLVAGARQPRERALREGWHSTAGARAAAAATKRESLYQESMFKGAS